MSRVVALGCLTASWRRQVHVTRAVQGAIARDPALAPLLERALGEHARTVPNVIGREGFVHTVAWLRRGKRKNACVIATHCARDLTLGTVVDFARLVPKEL